MARANRCGRQGYDNKKFFFTEFFYNFLKYTASLITATFSYTQKLPQKGTQTQRTLFYCWICSAIISALYSYYWDLKNDWGFLQPNSKYRILRDKLHYHQPWIYYCAITINLILRFTWTLSISPDIASYLGLNSITFTLMISFLEMFRRCQWNFFRVEKEHIKNCGDLKAVEDVQLPVENLQIDRMISQKL